jgi:hypothetical protein
MGNVMTKKTYAFEWGPDTTLADPLPPVPDGWDDFTVCFDDGRLELTLWGPKELRVHFWDSLDGTMDDVEETYRYDGAHWFTPADDIGDEEMVEAITAYGAALFERFDSDVYSASTAALDAIRADMIAAHQAVTV